MTESSFATRSLPQPVHPPVADRLRPPEAAALRSATEVTFCVRGVISPLLSNLFLHYTFDIWMARNHPNIPFERYADDAICHCRSEEEARTLWGSLQERFAQCALTPHPDKTKVVYCKDDDRRGDYPDHKFDFLGYSVLQRHKERRATRDRKRCRKAA